MALPDVLVDVDPAEDVFGCEGVAGGAGGQVRVEAGGRALQEDMATEWAVHGDASESFAGDGECLVDRPFVHDLWALVISMIPALFIFSSLSFTPISSYLQINILDILFDKQSANKVNAGGRVNHVEVVFQHTVKR